MARKLKTKIGDIFSVPISETEKKYMQLIAFDLTQLNSDVIKIFERKYLLNETPDIELIIEDNIISYVHCMCDIGLKLNFWEKVGNNKEVGDINKIIFKSTPQYARKEGEERILISDQWYIWRINDEEFTKVGKLEGENRKAYVGLVINPLGIVEIARGNTYPPHYPDSE